MDIMVMTEFQKRVYDAVERIPKGRVLPYSEVARAAGNSRASRAVGNILHKNPFFGIVPCHRVVHADGALAAPFAFGGERVQREMLEKEGVTFTETGKVDMKKHGYVFDLSNTKKMKIKKIDFDFSVCQVRDFSQVNSDSEFCFIGKTDEENSLVCITEDVPENTIKRDDGWRAFRIEGTLDFSLIGILSRISALLAENKIGIFAVSTYNTDYILTKYKNFEKALSVLRDAGYEII